MKYRTVPIPLLHEALNYDPETGRFVWLTRPRTHFDSDWTHRQWNKKHAGKLAGSHNGGGYLYVTLKPQLLLSRVAWAMMTGAWPELSIDHINRVKDDNRWLNLRQATVAEQLANRTNSDTWIRRRNMPRKRRQTIL